MTSNFGLRPSTFILDREDTRMSEYFLLLIATVVLPAAALVAIGIWLVRRTKRGGGSPSP
jgi:hypothetical protein